MWGWFIGAVGFFFLFLMLAVAFSAWMSLHCIIRTIVLAPRTAPWPREVKVNLGFLTAMLFSWPWGFMFLWAIVYFFACYRRSNLLDKDAKW